MAVELRFHPLVESDLRDALDWYGAKSESLAGRFCHEFEEALDWIADNPQVSGIVFDDVRAKQFRRFPYLALYRTRTSVVKIEGVLRAVSGERKLRARTDD